MQVPCKRVPISGVPMQVKAPLTHPAASFSIGLSQGHRSVTTPVRGVQRLFLEQIKVADRPVIQHQRCFACVDSGIQMPQKLTYPLRPNDVTVQASTSSGLERWSAPG